MKNKVFLILSVLALTILLVVVGGCKAAAPAAKEPIKIGGSYELTGFLSAIGTDAYNAAVVYFEQHNQVAGRPIQFIPEDNATDATVAVDKARKLVETDKVCAILGPILVPACESQGAYCARMNVPYLHSSCITDTGSLSENPHWPGFGPAGSLRQRCYAMGLYAYDVLGYRTATTLVTDYSAGWEYQDGFDEGFESRGGQIVQEQRYPIETTDFTPFIVNMAQADCLCLTPISNPVPMVQQLAEQGVLAKMPVVLSTDLGLFDDAVLREIGNLEIGFIGETHYHWSSTSPGNAEFVQAFETKYGKKPPAYAGMGYISAQILIDALERTNGDTSFDALYNALLATDMETIRGHITFSSCGIGNTYSQIMKVTSPTTLETVAIYSTTGVKEGGKIVVGAERTQ